jgi:hypothetical protein
MAKIELGSKVEDIITGLEGIAICRLVYLNGCERYEVQPRGVTKDGVVKESKWFDLQQLKVLESPINLNRSSDDPPGGDRLAPPPMSTP